MNKYNHIHWSGRTNSGTLAIQSYPMGEPLVNDPGDRPYKIMLKPRSMLDLMGGLFFVDALVERGHPVPSLILPFVPGARQDRMNDDGDFLFTAKSVSKEINMRNFPHVTIVDPHSEVISGLIDRCQVVHASYCFKSKDGSYDAYDAVVSPDAGAEKRAMGVAKLLGVPLIHGWKSRDVKTGKIAGFGLEYMEGIRNKVLVVDDICDGGGTFLGLSDILRDRGIKADLFVTHGIFSQGTDALRLRFDKIMCTDSIDADRPGVEVKNVCNRLLLGDHT
jgi:ribose-phosphate pyrophosphokinase